MTPEELAQKHCWNGHDPAKCSFLADIRELFDTECAQFKAEIDSLRMLAKRTSPATEPCECPMFCSYHARSRFEEMKTGVEKLMQEKEELRHDVATLINHINVIKRSLEKGEAIQINTVIEKASECAWELCVKNILTSAG